MDTTARARTFAALGDAARLRIVDALLIGDRTVTELGHISGLPSNLLAHHLDVLEDADLIERRRSEGDARKRYVTINLVAVASLTAWTHRPTANPLFVCTHNSARSQFAAGLWRLRGGSAQSAGTHPSATVHPEAVRIAARYGVDLATATPQGYDAVALRPDLVISVCDRAGEADDPFDAPRIHWSIPDPVGGGGRRAFERAFDEIANRIDHAFPDGAR